MTPILETENGGREEQDITQNQLTRSFDMNQLCCQNFHLQ